MPTHPRSTSPTFDWTDWADEPFPLYRRLRDEAPVYWDERNQHLRPDAARRRLRRPPRPPCASRACRSTSSRAASRRRARSASRPAAPHVHPQHRRRRSSTRRRCAAARRSSATIVREIVDARRDRRRRSRSRRAIATPLPASVALGLIGLPAGAARAVQPADGRAARVAPHARKPRRELARGDSRELRPGARARCGRSSSR